MTRCQLKNLSLNVMSLRSHVLKKSICNENHFTK